MWLLEQSFSLKPFFSLTDICEYQFVITVWVLFTSLFLQKHCVLLLFYYLWWRTLARNVEKWSIFQAVNCIFQTVRSFLCIIIVFYVKILKTLSMQIWTIGTRSLEISITINKFKRCWVDFITLKINKLLQHQPISWWICFVVN